MVINQRLSLQRIKRNKHGIFIGLLYMHNFISSTFSCYFEESSMSIFSGRLYNCIHTSHACRSFSFVIYLCVCVCFRYLLWTPLTVLHDSLLYSLCNALQYNENWFQWTNEVRPREKMRVIDLIQNKLYYTVSTVSKRNWNIRSKQKTTDNHKMHCTISRPSW